MLRQIGLKLREMETKPPLRCEIRAELLPATEEGIAILADTKAVRAEIRRAGGLNPIAKVIRYEGYAEITYEVEDKDAETVAQRAKDIARDTAAAFWGDAITWRIFGIGIAPP
jgi:hypothetical protein